MGMKKQIILILLMALVSGCSGHTESDEATTQPIIETTTKTEATAKEATTAQDTVAEEDLYGVVKDGVYTHDFFGLTLPLPKGWQEMSAATLEELYTIGAETAGTEGEEKVLPLMGMTKHPMGSQVALNPSLVMTAEPLEAGAPTARESLAEYMEEMKTYVTVSWSPLKEEVIGGLTFITTLATLEGGGAKATQWYGVGDVRGYRLTLLVTYGSAEDIEGLPYGSGDDVDDGK